MRILVKYNEDRYDVFKDYNGEYISHIIDLNEDSSKIVINTKENDYILYTIVDLSNPKLLDLKNFEEIKTSNKTPIFITKNSEYGIENLIGYKGIVFDDYPFNKYNNVSKYLDELNQKISEFSSDEKIYIDPMWTDNLVLENPEIIMDVFKEEGLKEFDIFKQRFIVPFDSNKDLDKYKVLSKKKEN